MDRHAPPPAGELIALMPLLVATFDEQGAVTEVLGGAPRSADPRSPFQLGVRLLDAAADRAALRALVRDALDLGAGEGHLWFEGRYWHCRAGLRRDPRSGGWLIASDVTAEKVLQDRLSELLDAAPLGFTTFDADGVVTHASGSGYALVGLDAATSVGRGFADLYGDSADLQRGLRDCLAGRPVDLVTEYGDRIWQLHFRPHLDPGSGRRGGSLIAQDATGWLPDPLLREAEPVLPSPLLDFLDRDELTGLPGRRALQKRLAAPVGASGDRALAVLNVDGFGRLVAGHGVPAGDVVLSTLADRFREEGAGALLGRWHEDEFLVLMEGSDAAGRLQELVERLGAAAREPVLLTTDGQVLRISVTAGLVVSTEVPATDMVAAAHVAMRVARRGGPDRLEWYHPGMAQATDQRLARDLALAVEGEQLVLHFQPVVSVEGSALRGVEALIRWQHPERGLLMPAQFVELAEQTGHIVEIGRWVLRQACRVARDLVGEGRCEWVAANLSARQLAEPGLVEQGEEALEQAGCPPSALALEVTETAVMADLEAAVDRLQRIKALGVRLALDDFGTGYSSLLYLKHFPVDKLKIDRSFVRGLGSDSDDTAIVAATVSLARQLGISAIAEGVETAEQLRLLRRLGCALGQGYLFGRPLPLEALRLWLTAREGEQRRRGPVASLPPHVTELVSRLHEQGASLHTIAAALNAAGHRTLKQTRWSARSVALLVAEQEFPGLPAL